MVHVMDSFLSGICLVFLIILTKMYDIHFFWYLCLSPNLEYRCLIFDVQHGKFLSIAIYTFLVSISVH